MAVRGSFQIDQTIGRDVKLEVNYGLPDKNTDGTPDANVKLTSTAPGFNYATIATKSPLIFDIEKMGVI